MSCPAARRGPDPIAPSLTFRLLWHEVTVGIADDATEPPLSDAVPFGEHPFDATRRSATT